MSIVINADDYGLSLGVTDNILDAYDNGVLSNTSIIPNTNVFDYAINQYKIRKNLGLSIHLNLVEGKPLMPSKNMSLLVNKDGEYYHSFVSLWTRYLISNRSERLMLRSQVKQELRAQIKKVVDCFDDNFEIKIDSHLHFHLVPFVFNELLELKREFNIQYIRLPSERFFSYGGNGQVHLYFSSNIIKYWLLKYLSTLYRPMLSAMGIRTCDHFIGVLFTGQMTEGAVRCALMRINSHYRRNHLVEILFHPGGAKAGEENLWSKRDDLKRYYYSDWRSRELDTIKCLSFKDLIKSFEGQ
jgi:chitin disaccharide deacetylase